MLNRGDTLDGPPYTMISKPDHLLTVETVSVTVVTEPITVGDRSGADASAYAFALAEAEDDAGLRERMAADWMPGRISLSFRREPSYFAGCAVQGEGAEVIKCTHRASGRIIGLGSRLRCPTYINGQASVTGYLADLRCHPDHRRGTLLARGYRMLRELHERNPVPLYYSLILEGNEVALRGLTHARAGLPTYRPLGRILTPAIPLDLRRPPLALEGVRVERGRPGQWPEILRFAQAWQSRKQLAPCYRVEDLGGPRLAGLREEDFYLARAGERLVGVVAAWDQHALRQTHVERYSPALALLRPAYNLLARLGPLKPLPAPGTRIPYFYLAFIAVEDNDAALFRLLLRAVYRDRRRGPWHYCIAGLHEADPLAAVLQEYRRIEAAGLLFAVHYQDGAAAFARLDGRVPYVEIAAI